MDPIDKMAGSGGGGVGTSHSMMDSMKNNPSMDSSSQVILYILHTCWNTLFLVGCTFKTRQKVL